MRCWPERCRIDIDFMPFSSLGDGIPRSTIQCRIDHFTLPNLSHAILYQFDIAADVGSISTWCSSAIWDKFYGKFFFIRIYNGISQMNVTMRYTCVFLFWRLPRISYFHGRVQPIIIFSQMLWILSTRLIEREINMHIYCSQWQLDAELYNSREKKLIEPWNTAP